MNRMKNETIIEKGRLLSMSISSLQEGMRFDAPVFFEGGNLFLAPGLPVRARDVLKLKRMGVATVVTKGNLVPADRAQERFSRGTLLRLLSMQQKETRCLKEYAGLLEKSRRLFSLFVKKDPVDKIEIDAIVHRIFHWTRDYPKEMIQIIHGIDSSAEDPAGNALHSTIIAVVMGLQKKLLSHENLALATAGFLHDVGMLQIPPEIRGKKEKLSARERQVIETHPSRSHALIRKLGYPLETADIVLSHHERWDGRGYPRGLSGERIPEPALIIAVADAYAALINKRPYRGHLLGHDALKTILRGINHQFNAEIVRMLLKSIGIYPLGSIVLLNNQSIGRVVETNEESALRPTIEIILDKYGQSVSPPDKIDLVEKSDLFIVRTLNPQDLAS